MSALDVASKAHPIGTGIVLGYDDPTVGPCVREIVEMKKNWIIIVNLKRGEARGPLRL